VTTKNGYFKWRVILAAIAFSLSLACSALAAAPAQPSREMADPIEPINRVIFGFNDIVDHILFEPVAKIYKAVIPPPIRDGVRNVVRNVEAPLIIANNLLQGDIGGAGKAAARFVINTTIGIGGLVDVAQSQGLNHEDEDFGQTLGKWGAGEGFYLVLPIIGPSSLRDTAGLAVDSYADPTRIVASNMDEDWIYYTKSGLKGLDYRTRMIQAIDDMRRSSLDYYAAVRSAYSQKRASLIRDEGDGASAGAGYASGGGYYDAPQ